MDEEKDVEGQRKEKRRRDIEAEGFSLLPFLSSSFPPPPPPLLRLLTRPSPAPAEQSQQFLLQPREQRFLLLLFPG